MFVYINTLQNETGRTTITSLTTMTSSEAKIIYND